MEIPAVRSIPFFNYAGAFAAHEDAFVEILRDVIRRGAFIQQRDLAEFEEHLAGYLGVEFAIGVANATDGLGMALRAAGIGAGDEVIFPSHTMVASAAAVAHLGARPVPADCGADHLLDPESVEQMMTPRTRAIMPVQLNGRTADMDAILTIAQRHDVLIIEDAAQGLGSRFKGRLAGTFGLAAAFSFFPAKTLGCLGDGGAVVTNDQDIARKVTLLRDHGRDDSGEVRCWGFNSRLDNLQAAILDHQFKDYETVIERRRSLARAYRSALADVREIVLPPGPDDDADHFDVYQNYEIEAERRDELRRYLAEHGVGTLVQWGGKAVHQFTGLGLNVTLSNTERMFKRCLMLPMNLTVTDDDVHYIAAAIRGFFGAD